MGRGGPALGLGRGRGACTLGIAGTTLGGLAELAGIAIPVPASSVVSTVEEHAGRRDKSRAPSA
ncbi:MAG: hypothetical protein LBE25_03250 [Arthrobacter sp.]|nr:hypothetical protein [Arthrobacter sp.]